MIKLPLKPFTKKRDGGFIDILIAVSLLMMVLWSAYYISERTVTDMKSNKKRNERLSYEMMIRYLYETIDCCQTLAPYEAAIDGATNCAALHALAPPTFVPPHPNQDKFTIIPRNERGEILFNNWTVTNPPGTFPGFGIDGFNVGVKCLDDANTSEDAKGAAKGRLRSLAVYTYADRNDPLTGASLATPKRYQEAGYFFCLCNDIFWDSYSGSCSDGGAALKSKGKAWGLQRRKCSLWTAADSATTTTTTSSTSTSTAGKGATTTTSSSSTTTSAPKATTTTSSSSTTTSAPKATTTSSSSTTSTTACGATSIIDVTNVDGSNRLAAAAWSYDNATKYLTISANRNSASAMTYAQIAKSGGPAASQISWTLAYGPISDVADGKRWGQPPPNGATFSIVYQLSSFALGTTYTFRARTSSNGHGYLDYTATYVCVTTTSTSSTTTTSGMVVIIDGGPMMPDGMGFGFNFQNNKNNKTKKSPKCPTWWPKDRAPAFPPCKNN